MRGSRAKQLRRIAQGMVQRGHALWPRRNNERQMLTGRMRHTYQALKGRRQP